MHTPRHAHPWTAGLAHLTCDKTAPAITPLGPPQYTTPRIKSSARQSSASPFSTRKNNEMNPKPMILKKMIYPYPILTYPEFTSRQRTLPAPKSSISFRNGKCKYILAEFHVISSDCIVRNPSNPVKAFSPHYGIIPSIICNIHRTINPLPCLEPGHFFGYYRIPRRSQTCRPWIEKDSE